MAKKAMIRESVKLYSKSYRGTPQVNERVIEDNYTGGKDTSYSLNMKLNSFTKKKWMSTENKKENPSRFEALKGSFESKAPSKYKSKKK